MRLFLFLNIYLYMGHFFFLELLFYLLYIMSKKRRRKKKEINLYILFRIFSILCQHLRACVTNFIMKTKEQKISKKKTSYYSQKTKS
jgi:hypothetical protein